MVRQATADLSDPDRLVARVTHLRAMVTWADAVPQDLGPLPVVPDRVRTRCEAALALAHRVLADRDDPDKGAQVRSVVDPDARCGKHGAYCDGSLLDSSLDADSALLHGAQYAVPGGEWRRARDAQTLLAAEQQAHGNTVEAVSMDGIGWNGAVLRTLLPPRGWAWTSTSRHHRSRRRGPCSAPRPLSWRPSGVWGPVPVGNRRRPKSATPTTPAGRFALPGASVRGAHLEALVHGVPNARNAGGTLYFLRRDAARSLRRPPSCPLRRPGAAQLPVAAGSARSRAPTCTTWLPAPIASASTACR